MSQTSRIGVLVCLLVFSAATPQAATLQATVVRVIDGDTVTVADGRRRKIKIRLSGIDAPEKQQTFGRQASENLKLLVLGKTVSVVWDKRDAYGRVVGKLLAASSACSNCSPAEDVGLAQISAGYAWWYRSESRDQTHEDKARYAFAENAARIRHLGLWAVARPEPPWEWRHRQEGQSSSVLAKAGIRIRQAKTIVLHPIRSTRHWLTPAR
ncbi:MAG: thermonuclease family protein [Betaproteobacteria bacterium]|nr:thermonuclease family protein [Betaproteobacteria bacterium]